MKLDVAVVGCGTGGPAAAALLARNGCRVSIFERAQELTPVGAGFLLQPTGIDVLCELEIAELVTASGEPIDRLYCHDRDGRMLLDLYYQELGARLRGLGMHRAVLLHHLVECCRRQGVEVELGCEVVGVDAASNRSFVDTVKGRHGPFDLLIIADGARSKLREQLKIPHRASTYPWGALWFMAPDPEDRYRGLLHQVVDGCNRMVGVLPTGKTLDGVPIVSLFWSIELVAAETLLQSKLSLWKDDVHSLVPNAVQILDQIHSFDQLTLAEYRDVVMPKWSTGAVVFIGDAAHATSPQLGQGANLALVDALVLAESLASGDSVPSALVEYERRRRPQVEYYQMMSRWLTPFFQSSSRLLGVLRDVALSAAMKVRPLRRRGVRLMAGVDRGLLRGPQDVAQLRLQ